MTLAEAIVCGILQGLSEFLPISSSGHLAIVHSFFHVETHGGDLTFDLLLHLGTLIVVFVFYAREIRSLIPAFFTMLGTLLCGNFHMASWSKEERYIAFLIIATLPMAAALLFLERVEMIAAYPRIVGGILLLNGFVLLMADRMTKRGKRRALSMPSAFGIGVFQLAAVLPGLSRSGATISGGLLLGLAREDAVKFSFILSIPAILGANLVNVPEALSTPVASGEMGYYLIGMAAAMISGFFAMRWLIYIAKKDKFGFFAYYCMAVGALAICFA